MKNEPSHDVMVVMEHDGLGTDKGFKMNLL